MAHKHGAKLYFQLLLDPNRAALMEELAEKQGYTKTKKDGTTEDQHDPVVEGCSCTST